MFASFVQYIWSSSLQFRNITSFLTKKLMLLFNSWLLALVLLRIVQCKEESVLQCTVASEPLRVCASEHAER